MPLRGESVGTAYVRILADGTEFPESLHKEFDAADDEFADAGRSSATIYKRKFREEIEAHTRGGSLSDAITEAMAKEDFTKKFFTSTNWKNFSSTMEREFGKTGRKASASLQRAFIKKGSLDGIEKAAAKLFVDLDRRANKSNHTFTRLATTIDHMADGVARAFGKGSRNDFINFFGSFVGNGIKMLGVLPKLIGNLGEFTDGFKEAKAAGEGFTDAMRTGFATMAKDAEGSSTAISELLATGPAGFAALAVAIVGVVFVLGPIAALISGITGAIIALASSISFAIVGAIAPLVGLLGPLTFGLLGAVLAIKTMDDATKKALARTLKPFAKTMKDLGADIRTGFVEALDEGTKGGAISRLQKALAGLDHLANEIGRGLGNFASHFIHFFNSSQFDMIQSRLGTFIPDALGKLGRVARNITAALGQIFVDTIPDASSFLDWLVKITREFRHWVHEHPEEIRDFLDDAADSAKTFGGLLKAAGQVLGDLLFSKSGKGAGDTIIGDMTTKLQEFNDFLDSHPHAVADFFGNAKQVARDIGNIALSIGKIIDALDTPASRETLHLLFDVFQFLFRVVGYVAGQVEAIFEIVGHIGHAFGVAKDKVSDFFSFLRRSGSGGGNVKLINVASIVGWIPGAIGKIQGFVSRARAAIISIVGAPGVIAARFIGQFASMAANAARAVGHGIDRAVAFITNIPFRIAGVAGSVAREAEQWATGILNALRHVPGDIVAMFAGLGQRIIDAIGSIDIFPHVHMPNLPHIGNPFTATGGVFDRAALRIIGEAGPEAVVPLNRPLNQVDPSVRWLSAIAQGLTPPPSTAGSGAAAKVINNEWHLVMPGIDPRAAAAEMLNRMVASAY